MGQQYNVMGLWLQAPLVLLCIVILVSSVPTSIQKHELEENDSFDSQLIEDNRSHFRGRQSGNWLESDKNDSLPGERRSRRRRRKHNRNCEQPGQCPEGGANWRRPHRRGKKHRTRCSGDGDCPEGQMCKERRHRGGRKHQTRGAPPPSGSLSPSSHSGLKVGKKFCRERKSGVHRRSGIL
ncbi:unnamed protein product [Schistosoma intercalatum]|nr:unnamed protein product [Schistosoma intercalatum]CAH8430754.1 unnamed protein product [Schistosoma intercalatum]